MQYPSTIKQDMHRASIVTTRAFAKPLLPWKSITYSAFVFVACYPACKQHAPYFIVICGLAASIFSHIISWKARFSGKNAIWH